MWGELQMQVRYKGIVRANDLVYYSDLHNTKNEAYDAAWFLVPEEDREYITCIALLEVVE